MFLYLVIAFISRFIIIVILFVERCIHFDRKKIYLFVIGIVTSDTFCDIYILFGHTFSFFSVFWLAYIELSWKIFKFLWGFKFLKSLTFLIIFMSGKKMLMIVMILTLMRYCEEKSMYLVYIYNNFILNAFLTFCLLFWHFFMWL